MPQYKLKQYGLKQYGIYKTLPDGPGGDFPSRLVFIRARIGIRLKNGQYRWVYQHTPVSFRGKPSRFRLSNNQGESILTHQLTFKGSPEQIRLSSNGKEPLLSQHYTKGVS